MSKYDSAFKPALIGIGVALVMLALFGKRVPEADLDRAAWFSAASKPWSSEKLSARQYMIPSIKRRIFAGKTTKAQVTDLLGQPRDFSTDTFAYSVGHAGLGKEPVFLEFHFDKQGKVAKVEVLHWKS